MELRHLRYFVAVAEELHFARAAERLNIAPPTLSHQIRALESLLGARLLARKTRSAVSLTHTGRRFLEEARATVRQMEKAELVGRRAARADSGAISIGFVASAAYVGLLQQAIRALRAACPGILLHLRRMEAFPQMKALVDGELDVGFTRTPLHYPPELTGFVVDRRPFCLALPQGHPLARRKTISPDALAGEPFVAASLEMEVDFRGNISAVTAPSNPPRIVANAPDTMSVLSLVAAGVGIAVVAQSLEQVSIPGVVYRSVSGAQRSAEISVVHRRNEDAPTVRALIRLLSGSALPAKPAPAAARPVALKI